MKSLQTSDFKVSLYSPPRPKNERLADLELPSQVGLQNSKCILPLCHYPLKWKVGRLGIFKSTLPLPLQMKSWQIRNFQVKLVSKFQSVTLPSPTPTLKLKSSQIWKFQVKLDFTFQSATLPHPTPTWKVDRFGTFKSSQASHSKCQFIPHLPHKWKVGRFVTFKSGWTSHFKVPLYNPTLPKAKSWKIWKF